MIKYYGFSEAETKSKISWQNLMMMNAVIPPSDVKKDNTDNKLDRKPTGQSMSFFELGKRLSNGEGA